MILQKSAYLAAARRLRKIADALETRSAPKTVRQKAALTSAIHGLARYATRLSARHRFGRMEQG